MKIRRIRKILATSFLFSSFAGVAHGQTSPPNPGAGTAIVPAKPPSVQIPAVLPPKAPVAPSTAQQLATPAVPPQTTTAPTTPAASVTTNPAAAESKTKTPTTSAARAPLITTAYSDSDYQKAASTGAAVILIFSSAQDPVWVKQAPILQTVLREPEFRTLASFQIDLADEVSAQKFRVPTAGVLVIMKDGVERIRSHRMTSADVIRKMLRLQSAL